MNIFNFLENTCKKYLLFFIERKDNITIGQNTSKIA